MIKQKKKTKVRRTILQPTSIFIVEHGGYPFDVMVSIGASDDQITAALVGRGMDESVVKAMDGLAPEKPGCHGRCAMLEGGQTVLALRGWGNTPEFYSRLAHEVFHAVEFLMDRIGIRLCFDSAEAFTYAIEYLTRRILEELDKPPSKRNRAIRL